MSTDEWPSLSAGAPWWSPAPPAAPGMERGSAAASAAAPAEDGEGCAGLWELPVECCERRPECGRCR